MLDEKAQHSPLDNRTSGGFAQTAPSAVAGRVLCVGGAAIDSTFLARQPIVAGTSNPAEGSRTFGGVARNVAENLARLGARTAIVSLVGDDENGRRLKRHLDELGIDATGLGVDSQSRTAEYMALLEPDRSLAVGVADMAIFDRLDHRLMPAVAARLDQDWIFVDCNCGADLLRVMTERPHSFTGRIALDAVSVAKAERLPDSLGGIDLLFLNLDEAASILRQTRAGLMPPDAIRRLHAKGATSIVLTLGAEGLLVADGEAEEPVHLPSVAANVSDVTGAGDALVATTLAAMLAGLPLPLAARWGCVAATLTLERIGSTRSDLSFALMRERAERLPVHPL